MATTQTTVGGDMAAGTEQNNTPLKWVAPIANILGGFDADVCASSDSNLADHNQRGDGGLALDWDQFSTVWCNHPYGSGESEKWLGKAAATDHDTTVVTLSRGDPSTDYFHDYLMEADLICFPDTRISFIGNSSTPRFGNVYGVFGEYPLELEALFERWGVTFTDLSGADDWWLAWLSISDRLKLSVATSLPGSPVGVSENPVVTPETAKEEDGRLLVLTRNVEDLDEWYLLSQRPGESSPEIRCAVDTGDGWQHVELTEITVLEAGGQDAGVVSLPLAGPSPLEGIREFI